MMVIAMHYINNFFRPFIFGDPMKHEAVHDVFEERPEQHADQEKYSDSPSSITCSCDGQIRQTDKRRSVQRPNNERMRFSQHFQVSVLEELCLAFIMDFLKLHPVAKIRIA
jgi:hypothetical protein